jgi:hypothetical protein
VSRGTSQHEPGMRPVLARPKRLNAARSVSNRHQKTVSVRSKRKPRRAFRRRQTIWKSMTSGQKHRLVF